LWEECDFFGPFYCFGTGGRGLFGGGPGEGGRLIMTGTIVIDIVASGKKTNDELCGKSCVDVVSKAQRKAESESLVGDEMMSDLRTEDECLRLEMSGGKNAKLYWAGGGIYIPSREVHVIMRTVCVK
jgi:hypothetical protein